MDKPRGGSGFLGHGMAWIIRDQGEPGDGKGVR
jgi:hypothetical protein